MRGRLALGVVALIVAACASSARGDDALKDAAALKAAESALLRSIAGKHVTAARRLSDRKREAFDELALGLLLDPDNKLVRERLGFRREKDAWVGAPQPPPPAETDLPKRDAKQLETEHKENAQKIVALAKRAKAGGLAGGARRLAALAVEEWPDDKAARDLLGHESGFTIDGVAPPKAAKSSALIGSATLVAPPRGVLGQNFTHRET